MNDQFKKDIGFHLAQILSGIGMDRPSNFDDILEYVYNNVKEAANPVNWHSGDVIIAFRRWIEEQSLNNRR